MTTLELGYRILQVQVSAGTIEYVDTGGDGPVLVFGHGVPMTPTQWRKVVPLLDGYRCVLPTLPLGGHRLPMAPDADLSQFGVARLLGELLERLQLDDVTVVLNDWGGGQFLLTEHFPGSDRVARLVLVACEAFENFPPGPAKPISTFGRVPGGVWLLLQLLRVRAIRDQPTAYGGMSVRGIPEHVLTEWFRPARQSRSIRRDFAKFVTGAPSRDVLLAAAERLRDVDMPALVVWADSDRLMPKEHGLRLAELLPQGRLVEVEDSSTLVPEDQPERLAALITEFVSVCSGSRPVDGPTEARPPSADASPSGATWDAP
jgi:pimeloyl-ACP methyl ester carboxylesterase